MKITDRERKPTADWALTDWRAGWWLRSWPSQCASGAERKEPVADLVKVSERKHDVRSGQVLGQAPIAHLGEAPQLLDHPKRVLAARSGPRPRPVDQAPALAQQALRGGTPIDSVAHPAGLERLAIGFLFQYA